MGEGARFCGVVSCGWGYADAEEQNMQIVKERIGAILSFTVFRKILIIHPARMINLALRIDVFAQGVPLSQQEDSVYDLLMFP